MKKFIGPLLLVAAIMALIIGRAFIDTEHPDDYENKNFTYLAQPDDISCGPTSAAMLLSHYGKNVPVEDVSARTRTKWFAWNGQNVGMTAPEYIEVALRHFGVPAKMQRGSFANLKHFISHGRPAVVLVRSGETTWHYVVVIGYTKEQVILADPGPGERITLPSKHFLTSWEFTTDMDGNVCGHPDVLWGRVDPLKDLLRLGEVYPNTMIVPERSND